MKIGDETQTIEFKESTGEIHQGIEAIASILNKHSQGELYFGVKDDGTVKGQIVKDSTIKSIADAILRDIEPRINPTIEKVTFEDLDYIKVSFYGMQKPYSAFGRFLVRVGTQNRQMTRDELRRLIKNEDYSYPWERETNDLVLDDIDDTSLKNYYDEAISCGRLTMNLYDKISLLSSLDLYKNNKLNNAAYALFGKNAKVGLKLATYATDDKLTFTDLKLFNDNIYNLFDIAIKYILDHINWKMRIELKREAIPEIPVDAIREIVVNAFAHAIYEPLPEIEINIHPGKITIFNPGSFPDELTPIDFINDNIPSIKRNPLILDVLYRCKNVEKSGTGFKRMNSSCKNANLKWDFKLTAYGFLFNFYRNNVSLSDTLDVTLTSELNDSEKRVYDMIKNNKKITRKEMSITLDKNIRTIQRITGSLVNKGYISRIGNNRFGYWEILK